MHKRVLLLGPTGINKGIALEKLANSAKRDFGRDIAIFDFEKTFLRQAANWSGWSAFLFGAINFQSLIWQQGWEKFREHLQQVSADSPVVLSVHGVYATDDSGVRSILAIERIVRDFAPTLIVTLIDDVYNMWRRTEVRADGEALKGRPTLEQLLEARRAETLIGELIGCQPSLPRQARHVLLSVQHPVEVLRDLITFDSEIVYMSFPISAPRELRRDHGDDGFINAINAFHREVLRTFRGKGQPKRVFISPLSIDELPLCEAIDKAAAEGRDEIAFDAAVARWRISEIWGDAEVLAEEDPKALPIPAAQAMDVAGLIRTDVAWRDFRLVRQAKALGVYCPVGPKRERMARGVVAEIQAAVQIGGIPIYIWQNAEWDPQDIVSKFRGTVGSMGMDKTQFCTTIVPTKDELLRRMLSP